MMLPIRIQQTAKELSFHFTCCKFLSLGFPSFPFFQSNAQKGKLCSKNSGFSFYFLVSAVKGNVSQYLTGSSKLLPSLSLLVLYVIKEVEAVCANEGKIKNRCAWHAWDSLERTKRKELPPANLDSSWERNRRKWL